MPLQFTLTNRVSITPSTAMQSLVTATVLSWVRSSPLGTTAAPTHILATTTPPGGGFMVRSGDVATGDLRCGVGRATTAMNVRSNGAVFKLGIPQFIGAQWDTSGTLATDQKLFVGDLGTPAAEPAYAAQTAGSGARSTDTNNWAIGAQAAAGTNAWGGLIYWVAAWNRLLTLQEIYQQQFAPTLTAGCLGFWYPGRDGEVLVRDLTGNGNHGAVTGAVESPEPLPQLNINNDDVASRVFLRSQLKLV